MCGIIASYSKDNKVDNAKRVVRQYKAQQSRGKMGYGFVAVRSKTSDVVFAKSVYEKEILEELDKVGDTDLIIFHHRVPTSSENSVVANHPIKIENPEKLKYKYFLIHNGHISNSISLKVDHEKSGFEYTTEKIETFNRRSYYTFTDSEALGIELANFIEGKSKKVEANGGVACFLLQLDKKNIPTALYYYRNENPINFFANQSSMFWSSEGGGEEVKKNTLFRLDLKTLKTSSAHLDICYPKYNSLADPKREEGEQPVKVVNYDEDEGEVGRFLDVHRCEGRKPRLPFGTNGDLRGGEIGAVAKQISMKIQSIEQDIEDLSTEAKAFREGQQWGDLDATEREIKDKKREIEQLENELLNETYGGQ